MVCLFVFLASVKGAFAVTPSLLTINPAKVNNSVPGNRCCNKANGFEEADLHPA